MTYQFPEGFWWGTATAAHQVEGGNVYNDNWLMEHVPESRFKEVSGDAVDHYHRYPDDLRLLKELGFNMYRFSLEWSRIEPEEGEFSRAALEHYRRMLAACHENGLTPMVTYHHFTSPRWLMRYGGWEGEKTPELFARFCERAARHLGDLTGAACTLNEINLPTMFGLLFGGGGGQAPDPATVAAAQALNVPPQQFKPFLQSNRRDVMLDAHRRAMEAIKSGPGDYPVGITLALTEVHAVEGGEARAAEIDRALNTVYLEALRGDDFVGVQTYSRFWVGPEGMMRAPEGAELTQMGYEFWPEALEATIRLAARVAQIPVIVTENGVATADDTRRVEFIQRAVAGVARCLQDGVDVRGYTYWSAFDNFEWMSGYDMTFGLIGVDRETQVRTVKPSARVLGAMARANAV